MSTKLPYSFKESEKYFKIQLYFYVRLGFFHKVLTDKLFQKSKFSMHFYRTRKLRNNAYLQIKTYFSNFFFSAGVGRTGVFITLSIVLERMQYEGVVDVFQSGIQSRISMTKLESFDAEYNIKFNIFKSRILASVCCSYLGHFKLIRFLKEIVIKYARSLVKSGYDVS